MFWVTSCMLPVTIIKIEMINNVIVTAEALDTDIAACRPTP